MQLLNKALSALLILITALSCNKKFYGTYNNSYSKDASAFYQIKFNANNTVEKKEVHTISDFAKGKFLKNNKQLVCYFDSSSSKFPPDTVIFKLKGKKIFFVKDNKLLNKKAYLVKQ